MASIIGDPNVGFDSGRPQNQRSSGPISAPPADTPAGMGGSSTHQTASGRAAGAQNKLNNQTSSIFDHDRMNVAAPLQGRGAGTASRTTNTASNIFGSSDDEPRRPRQSAGASHQSQSSIFAGPDSDSQQARRPVHRNSSSAGFASSLGDDSSSSYNPSNNNNARVNNNNNNNNNNTQANNNPSNGPAPAHTSVRVRAPPGGRSTISFG